MLGDAFVNFVHFNAVETWKDESKNVNALLATAPPAALFCVSIERHQCPAGPASSS